MTRNQTPQTKTPPGTRPAPPRSPLRPRATIPTRFMSAIVRLARDGQTGRPIYLSAAGAFNRTGAIGFARFMGRRGPVDEGKVRAEFVAWLELAPEEEIGRFIAAMRDREQDDRDKALAPNPRMRDLEERYDRALRATEKKSAQSSDAGKASGQTRGETTRTEVERLASELWSKVPKPQSRRDLAGKISQELGKIPFQPGEKDPARSQDRVDKILKEIEVSTGILFRRERR
jgi:hypothetical protein